MREAVDRPAVDPRAGFSLIEGLVALALTALLMGGISMIAAQWIPVWHRGFDRVPQADLYAVALDRIADDLAEARYISGSSQDNFMFFGGEQDSVTFVRPTLDPSGRPGLEVARITTIADKSGVKVVRRQARFTPLPPGALAAQDLRFSSMATLLRAPARIEFSYSDVEGRWRPQWDDLVVLPSRIRVILRDPASGRELGPATTVFIRAEAPARCAFARSIRLCTRFEQQGQGLRPASGGSQ